MFTRRRVATFLAAFSLGIVGCGSTPASTSHERHPVVKAVHTNVKQLEYAIGHSHHGITPQARAVIVGKHGEIWQAPAGSVYTPLDSSTTNHAIANAPGLRRVPVHAAAPSPLGSLAPDIPNVTPSGGWKIAYIDTFAADLGIDAAWLKGNRNGGCCGNGDEVGVERPEQATITPEGLKLSCAYVPGTVPNSGGSFYNCAGVSNRSIAYQLGQGATLAFELYAKLPYSTGSADPGWWGISLTRWPPEPDWFEEWAYGSCFNPSAATNTEANKSCIAGMPVYKGNGAGSAEKYAALYNKNPPVDPSQGFHKYTTLVTGSASSTTFTAYIDGVKQESFTTSVNTDQMSLILTNAMRTPHCNTGSKPNLTDCYFKSGTHDFVIRSAAIYVDGGHAGKPIIAPGTQLEGSEAPKEEPPITTEKTTPPPPPPPVEPSAPAGCKAVGHREGTSPVKAWVSITCSSNPATQAVKNYQLFRTGPQETGQLAGAPWPGTLLATPSWSNHILVVPNERYCYFTRAYNAKGESPESPATCVKA